MKTKLICVGKLKNRAINELFKGYYERIKHYTKIEICEIKDSTPHKEEQGILTATHDSYCIALSAEGKQLTSEQLAALIKNATKDVIFVIGGPNGLSNDFKKHADLLLSLSSMTFPHELTRVLLAEQIYRAYAIINKKPYHK